MKLVNKTYNCNLTNIKFKKTFMLPVNKKILHEIAKMNATWKSNNQNSEDNHDAFYYKLSIFYKKRIYFSAEIVVNSKSEYFEPNYDFVDELTILRLKKKHGYLFMSNEKDELFLIKESSISRNKIHATDIILNFKRIVNK